MSDWPKVTFGIIVFNGQPYIRYNLRAIYPYAHQIVVVEGAAPAAAALATNDGHSTDGTLRTLYQFKEQEDPLNKLEIVTREGFWSEKDEQSQAYATRAKGDYLWQIDADEFYRSDHMEWVLSELIRDPSITAVSFKERPFWGGFETLVDSWYLHNGPQFRFRLFRWGPGYQYASHRPPVVIDDYGRDLSQLKPLSGRELSKRGICFYHYSLVFPQQVHDKVHYYSRADWSHTPEMEQWAEQNYFQLKNPFRVHNVYRYPSWLEPFTGVHPTEIESLRRDIAAGEVEIEWRPNDDVTRLLRTPWYRIGRALLKALIPLERQAMRLFRWLRG